MKSPKVVWAGAALMALALMACTPKKEAAPAAAGAAAAPTAQQLTLTIGSDASYAPFEWTDPSGKIVGFDIDIASAMCEQMKAKCTFVNQSFDGIIPSLKAHKFDVIVSSMDITAEREKEVSFTQKIWSYPSKFVAKAGSAFAPTVEGLKGKTLGVQQATSQERFVAKHLAGVNVKHYKTLEDAYKDLSTGRIDVVFADGATVDSSDSSFLKTEAGKGFAQLGADVSASVDPELLGRGTGFAVRKEDTALLDKLNKAFDAVRAGGQYKQIQDKYFKFDIYGK